MNSAVPQFSPSPYIAGTIYDTAMMQASAYNLGAWPVNNQAYYIPVVLPTTETILSVSIFCGATGSGTFDLGIFDSTCSTKLQGLGSTSLVAGINTWTLASPMLAKVGERFHLGMSCSTTGATVVRNQPTALFCRRGGGETQQATAHPLPSSPTPVNQSSVHLPTFALAFRS